MMGGKGIFGFGPDSRLTKDGVTVRSQNETSEVVFSYYIAISCDLENVMFAHEKRKNIPYNLWLLLLLVASILPKHICEELQIFEGTKHPFECNIVHPARSIYSSVSIKQNILSWIRHKEFTNKHFLHPNNCLEKKNCQA